MNVTFDRARELVAAEERREWTAGTYVVAPEGWETDTHWLVSRGYAEAETDPSYLVMDAPVPLVHKRTGRISYLDFLDPLVQAARPIAASAF